MHYIKNSYYIYKTEDHFVLKDKEKREKIRSKEKKEMEERREKGRK
jgi:hypothetical protein